MMIGGNCEQNEPYPNRVLIPRVCFFPVFFKHFMAFEIISVCMEMDKILYIFFRIHIDLPFALVTDILHLFYHIPA
ncbi:Uncharacterised protein [Mycobacteroides abscessus subsp. abscessus]|nr:Uncharacterised protein [Mycobacteroides abscessus subsp. abscessus]